MINRMRVKYLHNFVQHASALYLSSSGYIMTRIQKNWNCSKEKNDGNIIANRMDYEIAIADIKASFQIIESQIKTFLTSQKHINAQEQSQSVYQESSDDEFLSLVKGVISLRDIVATAQQTGIASGETILSGMHQQLGHLLQKHDVEALNQQEEFDSTRHKIIKLEATTESKKDDLICTTIRPGYMYKGSIIRFQEVSVFSTNRNPK